MARVNDHYKVSLNFEKTTQALFEERVESAGAYGQDPTFVDIEYVRDTVRAKEIMDYFQLDTLYDAEVATWDKALVIGKFVAFNCRLHSIMTFELLTAAGIKARYITCLPHD